MAQVSHRMRNLLIEEQQQPAGPGVVRQLHEAKEQALEKEERMISLKKERDRLLEALF